MKKFISCLIFILILCVGTVFVFTACGDNSADNSSDNSSDGGSNVIEKKTFCEIVSDITGTTVASPEDAPYYIVIGEDDSYCQIDTNPNDWEDFFLSSALECIEKMNEKLGLPDYLYNDMLHTSYSQGKQEETFGNIKVKYYYHPDKGLNVTYYRI